MLNFSKLPKYFINIYINNILDKEGNIKRNCWEKGPNL
jgi:hypothetical protein